MTSRPGFEHQHEPPTFRRVFVVGCQRSGTTVIQSALARASGLFTLPETHYFLDLLGGIEEWVKGDEAAFQRKVRSRLRLARGRTHREMRRDLGFILDKPELGLRLGRHLRGAAYARAPATTNVVIDCAGAVVASVWWSSAISGICAEFSLAEVR